MTDTETWQREGCGEQYPLDEPPEETETHPGVDGPVTLWFCDRCTVVKI